MFSKPAPLHEENLAGQHRPGHQTVGGSGPVDGGESIRDYIFQNFDLSSTYLRQAYAEMWIVL